MNQQDQDYSSTGTEQMGAVPPAGHTPWPRTGAAAPAAPKPAKKVRRWPWALGALVVGIVIGSASHSATPAPAAVAAPVVSAPAPAAPAPVVEVPAPAAPAAVEAPAPAPAPVVPAPVVEPAAPAAPAVSTSQSNALRKAQDYLAYSAFSKTGLAKQLQYEGFSAADSQYATEHVGADWTAQADKKAKDYMAYSSFSKSGLIQQLKYEGFTSAEAAHGAASVGL